jgi:hypothetical protein
MARIKMEDGNFIILHIPCFTCGTSMNNKKEQEKTDNIRKGRGRQFFRDNEENISYMAHENIAYCDNFFVPQAKTVRKRLKIRGVIMQTL